MYNVIYAVGSLWTRIFDGQRFNLFMRTGISSIQVPTRVGYPIRGLHTIFSLILFNVNVK